METLRKYGKPPFRVAVVHGGPGAAGEVAPVAWALAESFGVLEPLQTKASLEGQIEELRDTLEAHADCPVKLVGHSWGAWLGALVAARFPALVSKLILVASGPFEEKYAGAVRETRFKRLNEAEQAELAQLQMALEAADGPAAPDLLDKFSRLFEKMDARHPVPGLAEPVAFDKQINAAVWGEAAELRRTGRLLDRIAEIRCPVTAIHGDYDPHPAQGVQDPLSRTLKRFTFILLKNCGHTPWIERDAREEFYAVLKRELG